MLLYIISLEQSLSTPLNLLVGPQPSTLDPMEVPKPQPWLFVKQPNPTPVVLEGPLTPPLGQLEATSAQPVAPPEGAQSPQHWISCQVHICLTPYLLEAPPPILDQRVDFNPPTLRSSADAPCLQLLDRMKRTRLSDSGSAGEQALS